MIFALGKASLPQIPLPMAPRLPSVLILSAVRRPCRPLLAPFFALLGALGALLGALGPHLGRLAFMEAIYIAFLSIFIDFWYQNPSQNRSEKSMKNRCQIPLNFVRKMFERALFIKSGISISTRENPHKNQYFPKSMVTTLPQKCRQNGIKNHQKNN